MIVKKLYPMFKILQIIEEYEENVKYKIVQNKITPFFSELKMEIKVDYFSTDKQILQLCLDNKIDIVYTNKKVELLTFVWHTKNKRNKPVGK